MKNDRIPYSCQFIDQDDVNAVVKILNSEMLTQGPMVANFEQVVADFVGAEFAIACNSATSALHLACLALGVGPGDKVWVPAISFVATANCVRYCGADVDFVDIDLSTHNICVDDLERKLAEAKKYNNLPKVIIVVHMCGTPAEMERINALKNAYGFKIVEDASHALGASLNLSKVGYCEFSDLAIFSFHPVKMITTGEGGMLVTQNKEIANRVSMFRSHGITSEKALLDAQPEGEIWNYQQVSLGFNYRMTDIQAALGVSQMNKIDHFVNKRNDIASYYIESFVNSEIAEQYVNENACSSYHLFTIRVSEQKQKPLYHYLIEENIMANLHYIPIYRHPYYQQMGFKIGYCPNSEKYFRSVLSIPLNVKLSDNQVIYVAEKVKGFVNNGS